jgi:hypothetical protein
MTTGSAYSLQGPSSEFFTSGFYIISVPHMTLTLYLATLLIRFQIRDFLQTGTLRPRTLRPLTFCPRMICTRMLFPDVFTSPYVSS